MRIYWPMGAVLSESGPGLQFLYAARRPMSDEALQGGRIEELVECQVGGANDSTLSGAIQASRAYDQVPRGQG